MRKTIYRLKKFRLSEISLVDRPACDLATVQRIELAKRATDSADETNAGGRSALTSAELDALPDSAFAYIEPGGTRDAGGRTVPRRLRHFPIHDAAHVRDALARAGQSPFGEKALPKILAAAKEFGIDVDPKFEAQLQSRSTTDSDHMSKQSDNTRLDPALRGDQPDWSASASADPALSFKPENVAARPISESIAGDPALTGSPGGTGAARELSAENAFSINPAEIKKYLPLDSPPADDSEVPSDSTTMSGATMVDGASESGLPALCDAFVQVITNILGSDDISDKLAAILAAFDSLRASIHAMAHSGALDKCSGISRWRKRALRVDRAMRKYDRTRALALALDQLDFQWPAGAAAIRLLGDRGRPLGSLTAAEFRKRGAVLSAANRNDLHGARDLLIKMCANAGCDQDQSFAAQLDGSAADAIAIAPLGAAANAPEAIAPAELGKMFDNFRRTADTVAAAAVDEVRKVAEASANSIRKSEGSAKVLSALAERIARLEAQPDNSRPQPLRTVEKSTLLTAADSDGPGVRIAALQGEAAELRKRAADPQAQQRLADLRLEIIRLIHGADAPQVL